MTTLQITIDGTAYTTEDDDQEASALLRLAGRDPAHYDLFLIDRNGIEVHIADDQIVDLRAGEGFRTRRKVYFTIDGGRYSSYDDDQTAAALVRLAGGDPARFDLARRGADGQWTVFVNGQLVAIADGDEFVTAAKERTVTIIVNTRPRQWREAQISYAQVVELAYPQQPIIDQEDVTVHYTYSNGHDSGTLTAGHHIAVREGMVFDVYRATRS